MYMYNICISIIKLIELLNRELNLYHFNEWAQSSTYDFSGKDDTP